MTVTTRKLNLAAWIVLQGGEISAIYPAGRGLVRFELELPKALEELGDRVGERFHKTEVGRFLAIREDLLDRVRAGTEKGSDNGRRDEASHRYRSAKRSPRAHAGD